MPMKRSIKLLLAAPQAKLNIIRDYEVVEKRVVEIPDEVVGYVKCFNPKCITNNESMTTRFSLSINHLGIRDATIAKKLPAKSIFR